MIFTRPGKIFAKPLSLVLMALVLLLLSDSALLFDMAVAIAAVIGLQDLYRLVMRAGAIRFSFTLAVSIMLGYGLGSLIYLVSNATLHAVDYQYWALEGLWFNQVGLSQALAVSLLASAALYMWAGVERPIYTSLLIDSLIGAKSERLVWLGVATAVLALYTGEIGYMGTIASESLNVSVLGSLANLMIPPLVPYALLLIGGRRSVVKKAVLGVALIILVATLFLVGRRYLLYVFVLSAIALRMQGYRFTRKGITVAAAFLLVGFIVIYYGFNFFIALRLASNDLGKDASLLELVQLALSQLAGSEAKFVLETLADNAGSRPFILSYLGGLIEIHSSQIPMYGTELFYSLKIAIPSLIMPGKTGILPSSPEELVHPFYGIPVFDAPNSFLVTGFDDFGLIGAIIYPLAVVWLFSYFYKNIRSVVRDPAIHLVVFFALMFQLLYIEQGFSSVFITLRNLIIAIGMIWGLGKLPTFRLTRTHPKTSRGTARYVDPANPD